MQLFGLPYWRNNPPVRLVATVIIAGLLGNVFILHLYYFYRENVPEIWSPGASVEQDTSCSTSATPPAWDSLPERSLEELRDVVASTKGFFVRDWPLELGWNNIRYILEAALLQAQLLNRTLVTPTFIYARACEVERSACAASAPMVNRNDVIVAEWNDLPADKQIGWRIPIELMTDISRLRTVHPIISTAEFLRLHHITPDHERSNGRWGGKEYYGEDEVSVYTIKEKQYDPNHIVRVDSVLSEQLEPVNRNGSEVNALLFDKLGDSKPPVISLSAAREALSTILGESPEELLPSILEEAGWVILHTWHPGANWELQKTVVTPWVEIAPRDRVKGFVQEWGGVTEEVFHLAGEIHLFRKPAAMRFTTIEGARDFASLVLYDMGIPPAAKALGERITCRIDAIVKGRLWVAAHMRRGDFVTYDWTGSQSLQDYIERVKKAVKERQDTLHSLRKEPLFSYDIPGAHTNGRIHEREPPRAKDLFYLATDERDPAALQKLRELGAIMFNDLITIEDRQDFGWPLLFTDAVGVVEQAVMAYGAAAFLGHELSSFTGGVINMRAAAGWDPRTAITSR